MEKILLIMLLLFKIYVYTPSFENKDETLISFFNKVTYSIKLIIFQSDNDFPQT